MIKKIFRNGLAMFLALGFCTALLPAANAAFTPSVSTVKIGIFYGSNALPAANLQNVSGYGSGYEFGYFNASREFIPLGASVSENKITMMKDVNMQYNASENSYFEGTGGAVVVGCFHILLDTIYATYADARAAADTFTTVNAFPKYADGVYYVCAGAYTSAADAQAAAAQLSISGSYSITSGTSYTVTVVETGTAKVLFEFDCGATTSLAVRPLQDSGGQKPQTWFKGYKYYGAFQYTRLSGGSLTVVNFVGLEDYIKGVVPYEMGANWPVEALKAQAVCARTYLMSHLNAHRSYGFDLCTTTDCQVYRGTTSATTASDSAVDGTVGMYLMHNGNLCETYYYSCNGGASENSENVWSYARPYLVGKPDPYEAAIVYKINSYYNWTVTYTGAELATRLNNRGYSCSTVTKVEVLEFTPMGNVYKIRITDVNGKTFTFSKESVRTVLGAQSQRFTVNGATPGDRDTTVYVNDATSSTKGSAVGSSYAIGSSGTTGVVVSDNRVYAITGSGTVEAVEMQKEGTQVPASGSFVITGTGSGHNVGMSQWGAYSMANEHGLTFLDILSFYYTGTEVVTAS